MIEYKNVEKDKMPFIPKCKDEMNINIVEGKDEEKIGKYNVILERINRENVFGNFYFNYNELKKNKNNRDSNDIEELHDDEDEI